MGRTRGVCESCAWATHIFMLGSKPRWPRSWGMGQSREHPLRADWEECKDDIMYEAVLAKFMQHADLEALLIDTYPSRLVEHTANDSYWGDGGDGRGANQLGQVLMRVRQERMAAKVDAEGLGSLVRRTSPGDGGGGKGGGKGGSSRGDGGGGSRRGASGGGASGGGDCGSGWGAEGNAAGGGHGSSRGGGGGGSLDYRQGRLNIIEGNLLEASEQYIAHQCNCTSKGAKGLADVRGRGREVDNPHPRRV